MKPGSPLKKTALASHKPLKHVSTTKRPRQRLPLEKQPLPRLRRSADKWFSKYVRLRDSERHFNGWYGTCITCTKTDLVAWIDEKGKLRFTRTFDNGHFVGRDNWVTRYEEENNNLQCSYRCNNMRSGELVKYRAALKLKYGDEVPEKLERMATEQPAHTYHFTRAELLKIINEAKSMIVSFTNH